MTNIQHIRTPGNDKAIFNSIHPDFKSTTSTFFMHAGTTMTAGDLSDKDYLSLLRTARRLKARGAVRAFLFKELESIALKDFFKSTMQWTDSVKDVMCVINEFSGMSEQEKQAAITTVTSPSLVWPDDISAEYILNQ